MTLWETETGEHWSRDWGSSEWQWNMTIYPRIAHRLRGATVVEIGCGHARWMPWLVGERRHYFGMDIDRECIDYCRKKHPQHTWLPGDGVHIDVSGWIDFVFSFDSLVYSEPGAIVAYIFECRRILSETGAAFLHHSILGQNDKTAINAARDAGLYVRTQELIDWPSGALKHAFTTIVRQKCEPRVWANMEFRKEQEMAKRLCEYYG